MISVMGNYMDIYLLLALSFSAVLTQGPLWDYMVFAQQWPRSICIDNQITHQHNCTIAPNITTWTLHGIWPTKDGSKGPTSCNESNPFDYKQIVPILPQLLKFWPNLYVDTPLDDFWEHEWNKHGRCASILDALDSEIKYFKKGLALNRKYDFLKFLGKSNIVPKDNYVYQYVEVVKAFNDSLGEIPTLQCVWDKEKKTQYLVQVEVCLSKTFAVIKCPDDIQNMLSKHGRSPLKGRFNSVDLCRDTEEIAYPVIHN